ncbi:MAG: manganese/iron transport system substrate-binding protein [Actinomycetota bacterium]|nr:manganese/iron transport system substrate-binding protein [Actinomycetota bacterium]
MRRAGVLALALALVLSACGSANGDDTQGSAGRLVVATTVAPITSIVAAVAGDRADVEGIVPEGTSSHTFEPKPSVAELLSTADLIFVNGHKLEDPTVELAAQNKKDSARIVALGTTVLPERDWIYDFSFPKSEGKPNPHLWTDPKYTKMYASVVRDELTKLDPAGKAAYAQGYTKYASQIDALDKAMRTSFATIPKANRKLLTYHDAYAYFSKDYGFDVIGAIQPSDFEEPTPKEVAALIDQIQETEVPAIFGSEVFPSPVLAQLGRETGVRYVDSLRDDDLPGKPGDADHSLLGLLRFDYRTMSEGLGGDPSALERLPMPRADDSARYPQ